MAFLEKKQLTGLITGIKALMKQYGDKVQVPVDVALDVKGKREEIPVSKLPTETASSTSAPKPWRITTSSSAKPKAS